MLFAATDRAFRGPQSFLDQQLPELPSLFPVEFPEATPQQQGMPAAEFDNMEGYRPSPYKGSNFSLSEDIDQIAREAAAQYGVDPNLVRAVIYAESGGKNGVVSSKGARGYMQLMPDTARELGVTDVNDPRQNIFAGTRYLAQQLKSTNGDIPWALAKYNAGPGAAAKGIPNFKETRNYISKIMGMLGGSKPAATDILKRWGWN